MKTYTQAGIALLTGLISLTVACKNANALCANPLQDGDFEIQQTSRLRSPWIAEGRAGADIGKNYSQSGRNNAWIRNISGWNGIRQPLKLRPNSNYVIRAYIRTSANLKDAYFGIRHADQSVLAETKFQTLTQYKSLVVRFRTGAAMNYNLFAGFWAPSEDVWVQVDNVSLEGSAYCPDT